MERFSIGLIISLPLNGGAIVRIPLEGIEIDGLSDPPVLRLQ